jgi:hypothetical protein
MISWLIGVVLVILVGDVLYSRAKLRLRANATRRARQPSHSLLDASGGGWRSLEGATERKEHEIGNPFAGLERIVGGNARRRGHS